MNNYENIIDHPHHVSKHHPPMPPEKRAAQFAPFAALSGFEEEIDEKTREVEAAYQPTQPAL